MIKKGINGFLIKSIDQSNGDIFQNNLIMKVMAIFLIFVCSLPILRALTTAYTFLAKHQFLCCVCAKCGSTSHAHWLWETLAGMLIKLLIPIVAFIFNVLKSLQAKLFGGNKTFYIQEAKKKRFNLKK